MLGAGVSREAPDAGGCAVIVILPAIDDRERKHVLVILTQDAIARLTRGQHCRLEAPGLEESLGITGVIVRSARDAAHLAAMVKGIPGGDQIVIQHTERDFTKQ